MNHFTLSLAAGAIAGAVVVLPMVFQRFSVRSCFASFLVYLFAGLIVFYGDLPYLPWWADGMGVAVMLTVPSVLIGSGKEQRLVPLILFNAVLLGFLLSVAEHYLGWPGGVKMGGGGSLTREESMSRKERRETGEAARNGRSGAKPHPYTQKRASVRFFVCCFAQYCGPTSVFFMKTSHSKNQEP